MTLSGEEQLVAAHCSNEWTLDPADCSYTDQPASSIMAFTPAMFSGNISLFFCSEYYQVLIATHLPTPLSRPRWLTTYPDSLPACKQSPVQVITWPSVD